MNCITIQEKAKKEWDKFCLIERPRILIGSATCGRAAGALAVKRSFEEELKKANIKADIYEVGCIGMCYAEPLVEIGFSDGRRILYSNIQSNKVEELVNKVIING